MNVNTTVNTVGRKLTKKLNFLQRKGHEMSLETAPSANNVTNWTALPIAFTLERGNVNFLKFQITSELSMSFNEDGEGDEGGTGGGTAAS